MSGIVLRKATQEDVSELARIKLDAQMASMPYKRFIRSFEEECEYLRQTLDRCEVVIALDEGEPVGFAAFGDGWLEQLFVDPEHYRQGIGTALLGNVQGSSPKLKTLVDLENVNAIAFYEANGFVQASTDPETRSATYEWAAAERKDGSAQ